MSNPEDNTAKTNGLSGDPMQRLASLKPPRDLTLGGSKANKKVFTPNLNVARNKKGPTLSGGRDQKTDDKGRKDHRNDRNRNIKNGPKVIKSVGVFSEGLGSSERPYSGRFAYKRDSEPTSLQKPTIRVKDVIKIDKELSEQKIKSVVGDCGEYDEHAVEDFKDGTGRDAPVKLPMDDGSWSQSVKPAVTVKQEVVIKSEPGDDVDVPMVTEDRKPFVEVKPDVFEDTDVVNLLKSDKPTLILLELPDTLPGRGGRVEDEAPRRKQTSEPSTSAGDDAGEKPVENRCRLTDLEEGCIGKLRVQRSGRVTLTLGETTFEVCSGTKAAFYQEAVSVAADDASRSANLISIGPVQHKLNIVPHWETMFTDLPV